MVKVLLDHQTFSMQYYGGISRYFANIQNAIDLRDDIESDISILRSNNHYIQDYPAPLNNLFGKLLLSKQGKCFKWNRAYSKYRIGKNDFDVLHPTYYHPYFLEHVNKPFVITVHDMIHEIYPEYFDPSDIFVKYKRLCVERAAHIIAISHSTKADLINILGVDESKISVIHHGYTKQLSLYNGAATNSEYGDYLLFVGDRRGYKNFPKLINAVAPLFSKNPALKLICAGGGGFQSAEKEMLIRTGIDTNVIQMNATDEQLSVLYSSALAFLYPSMYEGFGLPILEAFQNNCATLAADNKCFREIGGEAIQYFDPTDENDISNKIEQLLHNNTHKEALIAEGRKQLLKFPMESCINDTLNLYRKFA